MGPPDPGAGCVHAVRERGEGLVRGGGGPAHPAHHPQRVVRGEAECVQGGGDHTVVLSLHHRRQPGDRGKLQCNILIECSALDASLIRESWLLGKEFLIRIVKVLPFMEFKVH